MAKQNDDPEQSNQQEQPRKSEEYPKGFELLPIEEVLKSLGYSPEVIENYPRLAYKDLHLAELYRIGAIDLQNMPDKRKIINPVQAKVDQKGRVWVDVMFEKKEGVKLSELKKIMKVHGKPGRGRYISGRIKAENLPQLAEKTVRLQAARPLFPALNKSVPSIKADETTLSALPLPAAPTGSGVIIGIVDIEGCDFKHPNFINNKKTRLLYLWDQNETGENRGPKPNKYNYGVEYSQSRINTALEKPKPYDDLKYTPADEAHGTHVMDIAAGSSPDPKFPGVAPEADLIFVHIGKPTNPNNEELNTMGSSKYLLDAVEYIFEKAKAAGKPAVINISLAGNGGSHDGTSPIESAFDKMLKTSGQAIVIAAGNSYDKNLHVAGTVERGIPYEIKWDIEDNQKITWDLRQELEIWYNANDRLKVEVIDPNGKTYGECHLNETKSTLTADNPTPLVLIRHLKPDSDPGEDENHIDILIDNDHPSIPIRLWTVKLSLDFPQPANNRKVDFQAWIEYSYKSHSHFAESTQKTTTLNTIGNGLLPIVVGSYDPRPGTFEISEFSGAGPSRNKIKNQKPELCAPGEYILAARATTEGSTLKAGTSMSAPHVTGMIALMFQAALERQNNPKKLNMKEITDILINTTDPKPAAGKIRQYDPQSGFGHVNAFDALSKILNP
jgi:subtilisin family serine protease